MYAFYSGSYTSFLTRQCLNTVPVKLKKWYFSSHWGLWRIVKYTEIKSRKKRSKNLLSDMCIHFTELMLTVCCPVSKLCLWRICEVICSDARRLVMSKETSSNETCRETFWATALQCVYSSPRVNALFPLTNLKSLFSWNLRKDIWERYLEYGEKYFQVKPEGSFLWNCSMSS